MIARRLLPLLLLVATVALPPPATRADTQAGTPVFFTETGHTLGYAFRQFYDRQGGLPVLGLPLSEVYLEGGRPVQYFERARLEWHADVGLAQASLLGRWATEGRAGEPAFLPLGEAPAGAAFFPETGHSLGGAFRAFWNDNGGLATFGYPISEPFSERNPEDGRDYTVQYFERSRFEHHPEQPARFQVLLGLLGRQHMAANPPPSWAVEPVGAAAHAWDAVRPRHLSIPRIGVDVEVVEAGFTYDEWDVPRYTAAHYWPVSAFPNTAGNIVIAGHVGYSGIIFNRLPNVRAGDEIVLAVGGGERRYVVREALTLLPSETWVMSPTASETLTLITCVPIGVYSHRLIVRATPA